MTKVINKKALLVLLTLVLAFCWLTVPVSAAEVNNDMCANSEVSPYWGGTVDELYFDSLEIYAYALDSYGRPTGVDVNDTHASWQGASKGFFCYLPPAFYQGMVDQNYKYFYCKMTFLLEGTQLTKYEIVLDDEVIYEKTKGIEGWQTYTWKWPRTSDMTIGIKAYTESGLKATIWGRVILR